MRRVIAGLALAAAAGPALAYTVPPIMPVYGVSAGPQGVTVRIPADGCPILKSDLTVAVAKTSGRPMLLIARKQPSSPVACRSSGPADITWRFEELGLRPGEAFNLANPVMGEP